MGIHRRCTGLTPFLAKSMIRFRHIHVFGVKSNVAKGIVIPTGIAGIQKHGRLDAPWPAVIPSRQEADALNGMYMLVYNFEFKK
ncbi:MAG: hypothetical protein ACU83P_05260 [Gammaproteobacteria bacterium]